MIPRWLTCSTQCVFDVFESQSLILDRADEIYVHLSMEFALGEYYTYNPGGMWAVSLPKPLWSLQESLTVNRKGV